VPFFLLMLHLWALFRISILCVSLFVTFYRCSVRPPSSHLQLASFVTSNTTVIRFKKRRQFFFDWRRLFCGLDRSKFLRFVDSHTLGLSVDVLMLMIVLMCWWLCWWSCWWSCWYYVDIVLTLCWYCADIVLILYWYCVDIVLILCWDCVDIVLTCVLNWVLVWLSGVYVCVCARVVWVQSFQIEPNWRKRIKN
jgi:hypothetical protein